MFGKNKLAMVNLDKREVIHLCSPSKMLSSTNHIGPEQRGQFHDTFIVNKKEALTAHYTWMGYGALLGPRDEMGDVLNVPSAVKNVRNYSLYGSWYGDRIISYGVTGNHYSMNGNNPFKTATNDFVNITNQVTAMGSDLMTHFKILGE